MKTHEAAVLLAIAANALEVARWDELDLSTELNIPLEQAQEAIYLYNRLVPKKDRAKSFKVGYWQRRLLDI